MSGSSSLAPSAATAQLIGYGLLMGGAAIVGKLMIDGLVGEMDAAKARKATPAAEKVAPLAPVPKPADIHVKISDVVRFMATAASLYSLIAELPELVSDWGKIEAQLKDLTK